MAGSKLKWPLCGPKLSLCCSVISIWGIIQFFLLGIFFFVEAAPLLDDFSYNNTDAKNITTFNDGLKHEFRIRATNCWIAAVLYIILLIFSGYQFKVHMKNSPAPNAPTSFATPFAGVTSDENGFGSQHGIQFSKNESET